MKKNRHNKKSIKVVILCGGKGTRISEETKVKPKPMIKIGKDPIICHIMRIFKHYGFDDFILAAGYKKEIISGYFKNHHLERLVRHQLESYNKFIKKVINSTTFRLIDIKFVIIKN